MVASLREGTELFTTIVGSTASSLRNTVGQVLESNSASGPEVGELNVMLAGSSKSQACMAGSLSRIFRSAVAQDLYRHMGLTAPAKAATSPNRSNVLVVNPRYYKAVKAAFSHKSTLALDIDLSVEEAVALADLVCMPVEFDQQPWLPNAPNTMVHGVNVAGSLQLHLDSFNGAANGEATLPAEMRTLGYTGPPVAGGGNVPLNTPGHPVPALQAWSNNAGNPIMIIINKALQERISMTTGQATWVGTGNANFNIETARLLTLTQDIAKCTGSVATLRWPTRPRRTGQLLGLALPVHGHWCRGSCNPAE